MNFAITIISPVEYPHSECFREVAESLLWGLTTLGHEALITTNPKLPNFQHIILGGNILPMHPEPISPDSIIYNLEQVKDNPWLNASYVALLKTHKVWDYSEKNAAELQKLGIKNIKVLPIGYAPILTRIQKSEHQDIDIFFAGTVKERRREILTRMRSAGLNVVDVCGAYGYERDQLIARSKILLNLHHYPSNVFEIVRVSYLLANKCTVLSELSNGETEARDLKDGISFASYDKLVSKAVKLCSDARERERLSRCGFEAFKKRRIEEILTEALKLT